MTPDQFIKAQGPERQPVLSAIHDIIVAEDSSVTATVGKMMGKEMILYTSGGHFKYGLASVKDYMSLHSMPIYCTPQLHIRYKAALPKARFQKGCINFRSSEQMPVDTVRKLIKDCSRIDIAALMQKVKAKKEKESRD